jgi:hypothetical protein
MALPIDLGILSAGATRIVSIDATAELTGTQVLSGTPTITDVASVLTLTNKTINSSATVEINGATVAINKAIQFAVTGGVANTTYTLSISAGTTGTPAETLTYSGTLRCV